MFNRQTILALALVGIVLLFLPKYYELISPPKPPKPVVDSTAVTETKPVAIPEPVKPVVDTVAKTEIIEPRTGLKSDTARYDESMVSVETPLFVMTVASDGRITGYELKKYSLWSGTPVELHQTGIGYLDFDLGPRALTSLENIHFSPSTPRLNVGQIGNDSLVLETGDPHGEYIRLVYRFDVEKYGFGVSLLATGFTPPDTREFKIVWRGGVPVTEPDPASDHAFDGAYAQMGEELEQIQLGSDPKAEFSATGNTAFSAVRSKYFMAAVIPSEPSAGAELLGTCENPKDPHSPHVYDAKLRTAWGADGANGTWQVYWGPIILENLQAYNVGVENTMNWGWAIIKPFSRGMLWSLTAMHTLIHNYGIVIIIFSIFIKIILWPLTRKSQISMKKMAALQPDLKDLKEKHSKNPGALNKAMMDLYKERGVNPAAGCIPILLQMPLLYALFVIFRSTIEFRQAGFFGWISDLSRPDVLFHLPFSIPLYGAGVAMLPILMGISQFVMSKRTVTDPNQKMMIYIMPVFMTLIFNTLPSGLTLYYTLFNVLAIFEQNMIKLPEAQYGAVVVEDKPNKKKPDKK